MRTIRFLAAVCLSIAVSAGCESNKIDGPVPVPDPSITRLAVGESTTCAISASVQYYCWGENSTMWQYGMSNLVLASRSTPAVMDISSLAMLADGHGQHMCGFTMSSRAVCWGRGNNGQIGGGGAALTGNPATMVVDAASWVQISVSRVTTCGITTTYAAYCWGLNQRGEGGNASRELGSSSSTPLPVDGNIKFAAISAGWQHACALDRTGVAYCWGDNRNGQLGIGAIDSVPHTSPVRVAGSLVFAQLSLGGMYSCGVTADFKAYCWGDNSTGALGDGTTSARAVPTLVSSSVRFRRIATSTGFGTGSAVPSPAVLPGTIAHTCALSDTGVPYCWGYNGSGQLGDGTTESRLTPTMVAGGITVHQIGLGGAHTCGLRDHAIWCWGGNVFGQLGNGNFTAVLTPRPVSSPFDVP